MTIQEAFREKVQACMAALDELDKRSNPRPPANLAWLVRNLQREHQTVEPPAQYERIKFNYTQPLLPTGPKDKIARTFVLLEELQEWICKAKAGAAKHQQDVESQTNAAIVRLETYAALK